VGEVKEVTAENPLVEKASVEGSPPKEDPFEEGAFSLDDILESGIELGDPTSTPEEVDSFLAKDIPMADSGSLQKGFIGEAEDVFSNLLAGFETNE